MDRTYVHFALRSTNRICSRLLVWIAVWLQFVKHIFFLDFLIHPSIGLASAPLRGPQIVPALTAMDGKNAGFSRLQDVGGRVESGTETEEHNPAWQIRFTNRPNPATLRHSEKLLPLLPSGPGGVHSVPMRRHRVERARLCYRLRL